MNKNILRLLSLLICTSMLGCVSLRSSEPNNSVDDIVEDIDKDEEKEEEKEEIKIITDKIELNMSDPKLNSDDVEDYIEVNGSFNNISWELDDINYNNAGVYNIPVNVDVINKDIELKLFDDVNIPTIISNDIDFDVLSPTLGKNDVYNYVQISNNNTGSTNIEWDLSQVSFGTIGTYYIEVTIEYGNKTFSKENVLVYITDSSTPVILTNKIEMNMSSGNLSNSDVNKYIQVGGNTTIVDSISWNLNQVDFNNAGEYSIVVEVIYNTNKSITKNIVIFVYDNVNTPTVTSGDIHHELTTGSININDINTYIRLSNNNTGNTSIKWDLTQVDFNTIGTYSIQIEIEYGNKLLITEVVRIIILDSTPPTIQTNLVEYNMSNGILDNSDVNSYIQLSGNITAIFSVSWDLSNVDFNKSKDYNVNVQVIYNQNEILNKTIILRVIDDINVPIIDNTKILRNIDLGALTEAEMHNYIYVDSNNLNIINTSYDLSNVNFSKTGIYNIIVRVNYGHNQYIEEIVGIEIYQDKSPVIGGNNYTHKTGLDFLSVDWIDELNITDDFTSKDDLLINFTGLDLLNYKIQYSGVKQVHIMVTDSYGNDSYGIVYLRFESSSYSDDYIYSELQKSSVHISLTNNDNKTEMGSGTIIDYNELTNSMTISTNTHVVINSSTPIVKIQHSFGKTGSYLPTLCAEIALVYSTGIGKPDVAILEVVGEMDSSVGSKCEAYNNIDLSLYKDTFKVMSLMTDDNYINVVDTNNMSFYTQGYPQNVFGQGKSTYYGHWENQSTTPDGNEFNFTRMDLVGYENKSGASGSLVVDQNLNLVAMHVASIAGSPHSVTILNDSLKIAYQDFCALSSSYSSKEICQIK